LPALSGVWEVKATRPQLQIGFITNGQASGARGKAKSLEQYPKEIGELIKTLSRWRESLRASLSTLRTLP
jgi:hypothetical protein